MNQLNENSKEEIHPEKIGDFLDQNNQNKKSVQEEDIFLARDKKTKNKKVVIWIAALLLIILGMAFYSYYRGQFSFNAQEVEVVILGPEEIMSGEKIDYQIKYTNRTRTSLKNSKALLSIPEKFILISSDKDFKSEPTVITWDLGELRAGETGIIGMSAKIIGFEGSEYSMDSRMLYTPSNFNSEFQSANENSKIRIKITSVPFKLSISSSESVIAGGEIETAVNYENVSQTEFHKIGVRVLFPEGFIFNSSEPPPDRSENNSAYWMFNEIEYGGAGKIEILGALNGKEGEIKKIEAILEAAETEDGLPVEYLKTESEIAITEAPLIISQTINGLTDYIARKNEELEYKIKYQNVSDKAIKGLVINSILEGQEVLDFNALKITNGSCDEQFKITWSAFNIPELAVLEPNQEGEVNFKIKLKDYFDIGGYEDKEFVIRSVATVKSFNFNSESVNIGKIIASNELVTPVSGGLFLKSAGYYNDDGRIENEGPIPPTAGETTTYTVHWYLNSVVSDIDQIKLSAVLPEKAEWTGKYILNGRVFNEDDFVENNKEANSEKEKEKLVYYSDTREIVWEIPLLPANTGIISPVKEIAFQIALTPDEEDVGKIMTLVGESVMTAHDQFTDLNLSGEAEAVTTEMLDDESIGEKEGMVVESP